MAAAAIGAVVVGTAISAYGQMRAAESLASAAEKEAALREIQAREVMKRAKENAIEMREEGGVFQAAQASAIARGGVDIGSGTPLLLMEQTAASTRREIVKMEQEAEFRANQIRTQGSIASEQASSQREAGRLNAFGTLLSGVGSVYKAGS